MELGGFKVKGSDDCSKYFGSVFCNKYNQGVLGILKDVVLVYFVGIYIGIGLGVYIKFKLWDDMCVNFVFIFGEKVFFGWNFGVFFIEVYIWYFLNGLFMDKNLGYNFVGVLISYNFWSWIIISELLVEGVINYCMLFIKCVVNSWLLLILWW